MIEEGIEESHLALISHFLYLLIILVILDLASYLISIRFDRISIIRYLSLIEL